MAGIRTLASQWRAGFDKFARRAKTRMVFVYPSPMGPQSEKLAVSPAEPHTLRQSLFTQCCAHQCPTDHLNTLTFHLHHVVQFIICKNTRNRHKP